MLTVLSVVGTRPEAIKMAPIIGELARYCSRFRSVVCATGQHRELLDEALALFAIRPDVDLDVMRPGQTLAQMTASLLDGLDAVAEQYAPDWILAQGDTTSVMVTALVAFYRRIRFGHVEAGLRTGDLSRPYPEEFNRRVADMVAGLWFAPTELAHRTLIDEGCPAARVLLTGNTVVDALLQVAGRESGRFASQLAAVPESRRLILVTIHRRESFGPPLRELCLAVRDVAETLREEGVHMVCPVHPNPEVGEVVRRLLAGVPNLTLTVPLDYLTLVHLLRRSALVMTDSGGIQEEAPSFGVPVLVLRDRTERPEGVAAGVARLVGTSRAAIVASAIRLMRDPTEYAGMIAAGNPYGDGHAAQRIVSALWRESEQS